MHFDVNLWTAVDQLCLARVHLLTLQDGQACFIFVPPWRRLLLSHRVLFFQLAFDFFFIGRVSKDIDVCSLSYLFDRQNLSWLPHKETIFAAISCLLWVVIERLDFALILLAHCQVQRQFNYVLTIAVV